jgi:hypothetical protein
MDLSIFKHFMQSIETVRFVFYFQPTVLTVGYKSATTSAQWIYPFSVKLNELKKPTG